MYSLYRELIALSEDFEHEFQGESRNLSNFSQWLSEKFSCSDQLKTIAVNWEGKEKGRSAESIINTSLVHLYRYAKIYSKIAIADSPFSTIDDVIFLINLLHSGGMTKTQLIEMNIHEKSTGIQIINRLLALGFIYETQNEKDRRSKKISITEAGKTALNAKIDKIRTASKTVVGNLNDQEKNQLILLLQKLESFHQENLQGKP
ncbi:winged helix DNA-binding protein [Pedobacter sp. P351]|uniref:MarR family winged helix-turn-helix transcriptional regulator n=1 Tax=Pedobacter superstes TaxID=3133441 RepID=UPI0030A57325